MNSINTKIADAAIQHQVDLLRVEAGLRRDILALMETLSGDLSGMLAKAGDWDGETLPRKLKRLQGLKGQADGLIEDLYGKLETETATEMKDGAKCAAEWVPATINAAVGVNRRHHPDRRIRGRKEHGYADGLLPPAKDEFGKITRQASTRATRAAEGLALTSVQQVMADARMAAYQQNADLIKGVQQLSTLDGRTSPVCHGYDHSARALDGSPLSGLKPLPTGGPPWHWRCRSVLVPITKSWEELGIKGMKEIPPGTRASMDGQGQQPHRTMKRGSPASLQSSSGKYWGRAVTICGGPGRPTWRIWWIREGDRSG